MLNSLGKGNKGIRLDGMVKNIVAGSEYMWNIYILCSDCHELVVFLLSGYSFEGTQPFTRFRAINCCILIFIYPVLNLIFEE